MNVLIKGSLAVAFTTIAFAVGTQSLENGSEAAALPPPRDPKSITAREKWDACHALNNGILHSGTRVEDDRVYLESIFILNGTLCLSPLS